MIKLEVGERIGTYRVLDFIARGGFSLVYLAESEDGGRFALKIGDVAGGGRYVTRFLEEGGGVPPAGAADRPLVEVGSFWNRRTLHVRQGTGGVPVEIALDETRFPDGSLTRELELEIHGGGEEDGLRLLEDLLARARVDLEPSRRSKRRRLAEITGELA